MKVLFYISPQYFTLPSVLYHNFDEEVTFEGARSCSPNNASCGPAGFECDGGLDQSLCFGHTGLQVLGSLHGQFANIGPTDHYWRDVGLTLAIAAGFLLAITNYRAFSLRTESAVMPPDDVSEGFPSPLVSSAVDRKSKDGPMGMKREGELQALLDAQGRGRTVEERYHLVVWDLSVEVESAAEKDGGKMLLRGINTSCESGKMLAIMGPSGGGKTTMLDALNGESGAPRQLRITGDVTLNGIDITPEVYNERCAYVEQGDRALWPFLTVSEQVGFVVACIEPHAPDVEPIVDALLRSTGLASAHQTRAGSEDSPGLSGGQRRRLSLAIALAKKPAVLMADEPTSGLDSAAATAIVSLLGQVARKSHTAVVCTIHQPSPTVFAGLDTLLLLSKGCTVYGGAASELAGYLAKIGQPVPSGHSVAEYALDLVNADFTSDVTVDAVILAWSSHDPKAVAAPSASVLPMPTPSPRASAARRQGLLVRRLMLIGFRDPQYLWLRSWLCPVVTVGTFLLNVDVRTRDQESVFFIFNNLYSLILQGTIFCMTGFLIYTQWMGWIQRELKVGMYGPIGCSLALTLVVVVFTTFMTFFMTLVPWICYDLSFAAFPAAWLAITINIIAFELVCIIASFFGRNSGLAFVGAYNAHNAMTCGIFFSTHRIIWPLKLFVYILPWNRVLGILTYSSFHESSDFKGAVRATASTAQGLAALTNNNSKTYYCPDAGATTSQCYGITGDEILASLHVCACHHPPSRCRACFYPSASTRPCLIPLCPHNTLSRMACPVCPPRPYFYLAAFLNAGEVRCC